jgi:glycosyltransferase involved in cell wall biosynthesis
VFLTHRTIAVSETVKAQLNIQFIQHKMMVIPNGRTIASFMERSEARAFLMQQVPALLPYADDLWSVTVAELHPIKQHDVMVRAVARLVGEHPDLRHIIIGAGQEREKLAALIQTLHLEQHVFLAGEIHEAARILTAFDLCVLPSRSEALAYVIIEACIAGLPIVASNVGGIPEIITHEQSGILCPQGDVAAFAHAIEGLLKDETYRRALARAAQIRSAEFTFEQMLQKTVALYDSMNSRAT